MTTTLSPRTLGMYWGCDVLDENNNTIAAAGFAFKHMMENYTGGARLIDAGVAVEMEVGNG